MARGNGLALDGLATVAPVDEPLDGMDRRWRRRELLGERPLAGYADRALIAAALEGSLDEAAAAWLVLDPATYVLLFRW